MPSERQLAQELGVSRFAVQAALRDLETQGWIERSPNCRPTISDLVGLDEPNARPKANTIAIWMIPDLQDLGGLMLLQGIRSALGQRGFHTLIGGTPTGTDAEVARAEAEFLRGAVENPVVAGVILWDTLGEELSPLLARAKSQRVPVLFVDRMPSGVREDFVACNHRQGAIQAVRHLVELGHRRIAFVTNGECASSIQDRFDGFRSAILDAGLLWRPEYVVTAETLTDPDNARRALTQLRALAEPPTALFAINDSLALRLDAAARQLGWHVPQELSIVGFDGLLRWMPSGGELTTVLQPFEEIGRTAATCLLERIRSEPSTCSRHILLEPRLVPNRSTAAQFEHASG